AAALGPFLALPLTGLPAQAQDGYAVPWQLGLQKAMAPVMASIRSLHDGIMLPIITFITLMVLVLLLSCMFRFPARRNTEPSNVTHNTLIEVLWTAIPVVILVVIAVPSFRLLYFQDRAVDADMTVKAIGHQWYWSYEYPDHGGFQFESIMLEDDEREEGQP